MSEAPRHRVRNEITDAIAARDDIQVAVLYGSVLEDRFSPHSDVDLAVAAERELTYDQLLALSDHLGRKVAREVQVRDLRRLEGLILREVRVGGAVIKNKNPDFLGRRIADMLDFTEDWLPSVRKIQETAIRRFVHDA